MTHERTQLGQASVVAFNFSAKEEAKKLDIPFTDLLASPPPLAGHEKADSAFH
jgi:hypothetical protein